MFNKYSREWRQLKKSVGEQHRKEEMTTTGPDEGEAYPPGPSAAVVRWDPRSTVRASVDEAMEKTNKKKKKKKKDKAKARKEAFSKATHKVPSLLGVPSSASSASLSSSPLSSSTSSSQLLGLPPRKSLPLAMMEGSAPGSSRSQMEEEGELGQLYPEIHRLVEELKWKMDSTLFSLYKQHKAHPTIYFFCYCLNFNKKE